MCIYSFIFDIFIVLWLLNMAVSSQVFTDQMFI